MDNKFTKNAEDHSRVQRPALNRFLSGPQPMGAAKLQSGYGFAVKVVGL